MRHKTSTIRVSGHYAVRKPMFTGKVELYDLSFDFGEKQDHVERRPKLVAHAEALFEKHHVPDPNWKVRAKRKR